MRRPGRRADTGARRIGLAGADDVLEQDIPGDAVAEILVAVIDEDRRRTMGFDRLTDGEEEPLLAAPQDDIQLREIGGHADPEETGAAGARTAIVPG